MARSILTLVLLAGLCRPAFANVVAGIVRLPAQFEPHHTFHRPGHWKLPNKVLRPLPRSVDPREEMIIALEGALPEGIPSAERVVIEDGRFIPPVLAVRPGALVPFINRDPVMHLIELPGLFSGKRISPSDTGKIPFPKPGAFVLKCSEVPHLVAQVIVADKMAFAAPNARGEFRFASVPSGSYSLRVWYAGKWIHSQPLSVRSKRVTVEVQLMPLAVKE